LLLRFKSVSQELLWEFFPHFVSVFGHFQQRDSKKPVITRPSAYRASPQAPDGKLFPSMEALVVEIWD
jgi:hypothetical protein